MSEYYQQLAGKVDERFGALGVTTDVAYGELTAEVPVERLIEVCTALRDESAFGFEQLMDLCGVDYSAYGVGSQDREYRLSSPAGRERNAGEWQGKRFAAVYHLLSIQNNHRIRLRCYAPDDALPIIPSVVAIWNGVNWFEREAFDLYGIVFEGHPDMRRILTDYGFVGHPFRKDFPISGNVEMRYDPDKQRVIYQPVSIEPRELVPRIIRDDHRYASEAKGEASGA